MLFVVKLKPAFFSQLLEEAKATLGLPLFLLTSKKKALIVSFRKESYVLTGARTAG